MSPSGLTDAYALEPLSVAPRQLLLDPTNPRLITDASQFRKLTPTEVRSRATQEHVLDLVRRKEHGVKELITSISTLGFISGNQDIIVRDVGGGEFLVLEGNRRTAAIKHLLSRPSELRADVVRSIQRINVKRFIYKRNAEFDEARVLDVLLGTIHISGPKEWGALERSAFICRSYIRELGARRRFCYDVEVSRTVGATFNMSPKMVHKNLVVARVYEQLSRAGLPVEPSHYTLIDLATKTRAVAGPYFELDFNSCELSTRGVERFNTLCLGKSPPVHNPKLFNAFVGVFTEGTELELSQIEDGSKSPEDVFEAVSVRLGRRAFREDLASIRQQIADLTVAAFQGTEAERDEIRRIRRLVEDVLVPLTRTMRPVD